MTALQINRKCHESSISIKIINDDQTLVFFIKSVAFKNLAFQAFQEQPHLVAARLRVHDSFSISNYGSIKILDIVCVNAHL